MRSRLKTLGYEQKDLARAARVTESYVSQLLTRRKAPPGRDRTDIYGKMESFLELPHGKLGHLAEIERAEEIQRKLVHASVPLFQEFRDLVLRKCAAGSREEVRAIFELQPFGTLERLVARKLLDVVQHIARQELDSENWMRLAARVGGRSHEEMRVMVLDFLDTDVFQVSKENCVAFLDPLLESWDIDLDRFRLEIRLNGRLVEHPQRIFMFSESQPEESLDEEPGLTQFMDDKRLSGNASEEEIRFLRRHRIAGKHPTKLYYYRALQNLRDPLSFPEP
ncbi:MAG TPA: XRE family transcriptional regulator [Candidatus Polarisedimenticolia bacterium]|nr:XRE family transcriptional regulator [Candidatus Polarisedimenticolia bacterium]